MKIAIVTGGSRGLGRNAAVKLAKKGVDVILTYHSKKGEAEEAVKEIEALGRKAISLQLDTSNSNGFEAFSGLVLQALKANWNTDKFDYLLNNAGVGLHKPFMETTEEDFDKMVNIHLKGVFFLTQKLLPMMRDGGKILNVSSGLSRITLPGYSAYATMKGGVEVLTRYLAKELGARKISVNVIAPGAIETDFGGGRVRDNGQLNKFIADMTAMGRVGLPDDIGDAMSSILAGDMNWVTGQRIEASGGQSI